MLRRLFLSMLLAVLAVSSLPSAARADDDRLVVVLPFDRRNAALTASDVALVEETIRSSAGNALSAKGMNVMTGETAIQLLRDRGVDLEKVTEAESALTAAKTLGATLFISGVITSSGGKHSGQVRIFKVEGGKLLAASEIGGQSADGLKKSWKTRQDKFFDTTLSALGLQPAADVPTKDIRTTSEAIRETPSNDESDDAPDVPGDAKASGKKESARLKRLCDRGDGAACVARGKLYYVGEVVRSNRATASAMFEKGCDAGAASGCTALGAMYSKGDFVEQDIAKARTLFRRGCDGADKDACAQLKALKK